MQLKDPIPWTRPQTQSQKSIKPESPKHPKPRQFGSSLSTPLKTRLLTSCSKRSIYCRADQNAKTPGNGEEPSPQVLWVVRIEYAYMYSRRPSFATRRHSRQAVHPATGIRPQRGQGIEMLKQIWSMHHSTKVNRTRRLSFREKHPSRQRTGRSKWSVCGRQHRRHRRSSTVILWATEDRCRNLLKAGTRRCKPSVPYIDSLLVFGNGTEAGGTLTGRLIS